MMIEEYINKDLAIQKLELRRIMFKLTEDSEYKRGQLDARAEIYKIILDLPTADVEPVRHGKWIPHEVEQVMESNFNPYYIIETFKPVNYRCSLCGRVEELQEPYCNCGAKMDGGKE